MHSPKVLIIGCGIAGPVVAILLKRKGYEPIVFEKVRQLGDAGATLGLMPNGMKVLNLIGLADELYTSSLPFQGYDDFRADGQLLGHSDLPSQWKARYGQSAMGVRRTALNLALKNQLLKENIELHEGWELSSIEQHQDSIIAHFSNGQTATGIFMIGCDGIKAASRVALLNERNAEQPPPAFTGLTQTSGISPTPTSLNKPCMMNWYGEAVHVIGYPISSTHMSWAITLRENEEAKESWRPYTDSEMEVVKPKLKEQLAGFEPRVLELVSAAERLLKFGIYDRKELSIEEWYSTRCVLVGDAAHPTSPHLGQGANQSLEDCYHLSQGLPAISDAEDAEHKLKNLEPIFAAFAQKRQPRTSALVRGARAAGETRVTSGLEACRARDERVRQQWDDTEAVMKRYDGLCREPFDALTVAS